MGSRSPKYRRAKLSLMIATLNVKAPPAGSPRLMGATWLSSRESKSRPATIGTPRVAKNPEVIALLCT